MVDVLSILCGILIIFIAIIIVISFVLRPHISWKSNASLDGRVVVITGANTGIGKETALDLARRNAKVFLACRSESRGLQAQDDIRKESGNDKVYFMELDLASLQSVRSFVEKFCRQEYRLDLLINNAGILPYKYSETLDGYESAFGVNHLGSYLLTMLLLPLLMQSYPSRIVMVTSMMYKFAKIDLQDLNQKDSYSGRIAYSNSKLASILFAQKLSLQLAGTGVTINSAHPGIVLTDISRDLPFNFWIPVNNPVTRLMFKSCKEGAQTILYCALAEELASSSGLYFVDCKEEKLSRIAQDEDLAEKICELSKKLTSL